jgi:hypothetical protein
MDGLGHKNPPAAAIIITLMPCHSINPFFSKIETNERLYTKQSYYSILYNKNVRIEDMPRGILNLG